jgi:hypothetical protein
VLERGLDGAYVQRCQPGRKRLGRMVFPEIFARCCGPVAGDAGSTASMAALGTARGAFLRSWRLLAIDGFEADLPDSDENAAEFGYAGPGTTGRRFPRRGWWHWPNAVPTRSLLARLTPTRWLRRP